MSGNQTSNTTQTQTQMANPVAQAAIAPIASMAPGIANTSYNVGMNTNVAGLNPQQLAAIQGLGGLQANNPASPYITQANQYSQLAANPQNVVNMAQQFYNPMSQQVLNQLGNVFGQQNAQMLGNAAASGSIGGSRYGVAAGNLANQQGLAAGQTLAGLQQQALNAAQTEQGQISQQAFTQAQLGNEALNTQIQGINAALQGGNITQQQAQALLNAAQQNAIQRTLFPSQMAAQGMQIAQGAIPLGGTTYGTGTTNQPVNYAGMILGGGLAGVGALGGVGGIQGLFGGSNQPQYGAYGGAIRKKRQEGGATTESPPLENYFEHQPQVNVAQAHYPTLNLGQQGGQGSAGQSAGAGGGGLGGLGSLASLGSSAMGGLSGIGSAIGSGIGELGGAIGGALGGAGEFLPMLALLKDGGTVKHRAIGGGTGVGRGTSGLLGYSGLSGGLEPYFAKAPKVNLSPANFPTLNLGQGPNTAQQQADQQTQQMAQLGKLGADLGQSGGLTGTMGADFSDNDSNFSRGGRIRMQYGGDPGSIQAANDAFLANNQGFGLGLVSPAQAAVAPADLTPSATNQLDKSASLAPIGSTAQSTPPTMGMRPGEYYDLNYDGTRKGGPQLPPRDPALVMASIGSPAQAPAPIAAPRQPIDRVALGPDTAMPPLALDVIKSNEGYSPNAQWDYRQYSGGYGTRAQPGQTYTPESAQKELLEQTAPLHDFISQNVHVPLTQKQYAGLADFGHNLGVGPGGLTDLLPDINRGDWARVAQRMQHYNQAGGQVLDDLVKRRAMDGALVQNQDVAVNPPAINGGGRRSVLDRPDLQPPKPGESELDKRMAEFGFQRNQPQGLGGSLGRALGIQGGLDQQTSNRLVNMGLGMLAQGPTVGVKGPAGGIINTLQGIGKGGQFALGQEQQERAQAINLANAAMNQKLHEAQMANYQREATQPRQIGSRILVDKYGLPHVVPEMGQPPNVPPEQQWKPIPIIESGQGESAKTAQGATPQTQAEPEVKTVAFDDGSQAALPKALADKYNPNDPIDVKAVRIIAGAEPMPVSQRSDPRYLALDNRVRELDPTYTRNRYDYYKQYGGANGKIQQSFTNFHTAMRHASVLDRANWQKNVTDAGWEPINQGIHAFQRSLGNPELKNYEDTAVALGRETERTLTPVGAGTGRERQEAEERVSSKTPVKGRLSGNAANTEILLGKLLEVDNAYNRNMGLAASINKPKLLTDEERQRIKTIFDHEPSAKLKQQRYEELSKDPRTADLVSPPAKAPTKETPAAAQPQRAAPAPSVTPPRPANVPEGAGYSAKTGKWYDPITHQPIE